jgi:hypothetical protein
MTTPAVENAPGTTRKALWLKDILREAALRRVHNK